MSLRASARPLAGGVIVAAGALALAVSAGDGARGTIAPLRGKVAFVRFTTKSGHPRIYTRNLPGGAPERLRLPVTAAEGPAWSPGGRELVFVGGENAPDESHVTIASDLYVSKSNGTGARRLTTGGANEAGPAWAPDGRRIVFVRPGGTAGRSTLWILGLRGRPRRLTSGNVDLQPSWARDGRTIAFLRIDSRTRQSGIWIVRPDGSRLHRILSRLGNVTEPVWSPRESRLLVEDGKKIYSVRPDGRDLRTIATLTADSKGAVEDPQPAWSPDGRRVVFCQLRRNTTGRSDIWVVGADGRNLQRVTHSPGLDTDPSLTT